MFTVPHIHIYVFRIQYSVIHFIFALNIVVNGEMHNVFEYGLLLLNSVFRMLNFAHVPNDDDCYHKYYAEHKKRNKKTIYKKKRKKKTEFSFFFCLLSGG